MAPETLCRVRAIAAAEALGELCSVESRSALVAALPLLRRAVARLRRRRGGSWRPPTGRCGRPIAPALGTGGLGEAWQACTTLREHRGDGHVAALVAHGVGGVEAHVLAAGTKARPGRGAAGQPGLERGGVGRRDGGRSPPAVCCTRDGRATDGGRTLHGQVEDLTDRLAEPAYAGLSDGALEEFVRRSCCLCRRRGRFGPAAVPQPDGAAPPALGDGADARRPYSAIQAAR